MKTRNLLIFILFSILVAFFFSFFNKDNSKTTQKVVSKNNNKNFNLLHIIKRKNVDNRIYTQGLFFSDDGNFLYQSGGLYSKSSLTKLKFPSLEQVSEYPSQRIFLVKELLFVIIKYIK